MMSIKNSSVHHSSDDTILLYINKSLKNIGSRINSDLKGLTDWLNANCISRNISKTDFILFRNRNKTIHYDLKIKLIGKRLFPSTYFKYLRVIFDENLSWVNHLTALSTKLSRANSMLCKVRHFVDKQTLRSIYFAIFSSHLSYGSQIWDQQDNPNISKIISLQKITLRIITFSPFRYPTFSLFPEVKILKFEDFVNISNCLFVYNHLHNNLPNSISNFFAKTSDIHTYATRNNEHGKLNIPRVYTRRYGKYSIKQQCILNCDSSLSSCRQNFLNNAQNYPVTINNMTRNQYQKMLHKIFFLYLSSNKESVL